tara:strand:+ start:310 stop:1410 length:1101 start_codon:yes stop_codon:yes gene_type:complete
VRKYLYLLLVISLTFCTSNTTDEENEVTTTSQNVVTTVVSDVQPIPEDTTPQYIFDIEKMSPLTGKEISQEEWLLRPKRVLAFKVDNNINARPQSGLELSDLVFEILVEGGMTRFLAVFLDSSTDYLGPIRSARPTDPTLVKHYGATLVVSGATEGLIPAIRELGVPVIEEQKSPSMFRIASRNAPHNLYTDTELIREVIDEKGYLFIQPGPAPMFEFGYEQSNWSESGQKVEVIYSNETTVIWKYDGEAYNRFILDSYSKIDEPEAHNWISQDGFETGILKAETIIAIQGVQYRDEATTLPSILTVGIGPVTILNSGKYVEGTWRRTDIDDSFQLNDKDGNTIILPPGKQWIHILPIEGTINLTN